MSAVYVEGVHFGYRETPILQNVHLEILSGEFIGVIGPNGGGKTTLLKLLMGFLTPDSGRISLLGSSPENARLSIGYVPQAHRFDREFPLTVFELIIMGALAKLPALRKIPASIEETAFFLMEKLGLLAHKDKVFGALSGGLAQRALLQGPFFPILPFSFSTSPQQTSIRPLQRSLSIYSKK